MKKTLILFFSAIVIGGGLALYIFNKGFNKETEKEGYGMAHAFQIGAFTNYDNAINVANRNNGIVVTDNDIYRVYVTILQSDQAIKKMSEYYDTIGLNYYLKDVLVSNSFLNEIGVYEDKIRKGNVNDYNTISEDVLMKYQNSL